MCLSQGAPQQEAVQPLALTNQNNRLVEEENKTPVKKQQQSEVSDVASQNKIKEQEE